MEDVVEKMYNIFHANKQEEKTENIKRKSLTYFSITTLSTMNKHDLQNMRRFWYCNRYLDRILIILDYQRNIVNEEDSDISSMTDDQREIKV